MNGRHPTSAAGIESEKSEGPNSLDRLASFTRRILRVSKDEIDNSTAVEDAAVRPTTAGKATGSPRETTP